VLQSLLVFSDWLRHRARSRRWNPDRVLGRRGEDLAHRYLRRHGYVIVARNYRTPSFTGEADLVAWDEDALVFVEVKSRKSAEFGEPDRAVDAEKRERIVRAALDYTRRAQVPWDCVRFDVIGIVFEPEYRIMLNRGAFVAR
jgi:putative endonuclease